MEFLLVPEYRGIHAMIIRSISDLTDYDKKYALKMNIRNISYNTLQVSIANQRFPYLHPMINFGIGIEKLCVLQR